MGAVDDYISSLEGQENLDLTEVASKLLELHNNEMGVASSKISSLESSLAEKDTLLTNKDGEIEKWKAKNWDLVNQLPANNPAGDNHSKENPNDKPDGATIGFDDILFKEKG